MGLCSTIVGFIAPVILMISSAEPPSHPFFALCMDTHDGKRRNLQQQAELLKDLGYDGAGHLWLDQVRERLATLDEAGLKLFQVYMRVNLATQAEADKGVQPLVSTEPYDRRLKETLPLLQGRGAMLALLISGLPPSDTAGDERAVALVREIADAALPFDVRVVLYPHSGDWLERVEDGLRVAGKADRKNVGVMFNLCHWLKVDDEKNLTPLLQKAMPRLWAVSINGTDRADEIHAGKGNWIQPLDSGSFDVCGFLQTLKALGYSGPVGLQCYGIPGDARDHLTRSMAAWRKCQEQLRPHAAR